ncbi:MAG TPA: type VI secretion system-associated protein TagF [Gammaproteobacteria bacterium]|nr:type VI secretion system-associated protein TagF [Gammaproteobacteria bacterium]
MPAELVTGLFGKLPAHGDFIHRNLPSDVMNTWDEWLQHYIASSREQMGEAWLNIYLTSPVWRFVFSPGVLDNNSWAGMMIPSVDRVGRYFPFTVLTKLPAKFNPLEFLPQNGAWFDQIENVLIDALETELTVDDIMQSIDTFQINVENAYERNQAVSGNSSQAVKMMSNMDLPQSMYSFLLDASLRKAHASYSVWSTQGSERVEPCIFSVQGLPAIDGIPAMLDGEWRHWQWNQPYVFNV